MRVELFESLQSRFVLGLPALRVGANPLELSLDGFLMRGLLALLLLDALFFGLQPVGVVAFVRDAPAAIQLKNPARRIVEKVAVVGNGHHGTGEVLQKVLKPGHRFGVQVVGGLIE